MIHSITLTIVLVALIIDLSLSLYVITQYVKEVLRDSAKRKKVRSLLKTLLLLIFRWWRWKSNPKNAEQVFYLDLYKRQL